MGKTQDGIIDAHANGAGGVYDGTLVGQGHGSHVWRGDGRRAWRRGIGERVLERLVRVFLVCEWAGLMCFLGCKVWVPAGRFWAMDHHAPQKAEKEGRWGKEASQGRWSGSVYTRPRGGGAWRGWRGDTGKSTTAHSRRVYAQPRLQTRSPVAPRPVPEPKREDEDDPDDPNLTKPIPRYNAMLAVLRNTLYMYVLPFRRRMGPNALV